MFRICIWIISRLDGPYNFKMISSSWFNSVVASSLCLICQTNACDVTPLFTLSVMHSGIPVIKRIYFFYLTSQYTNETLKAYRDNIKVVCIDNKLSRPITALTDIVLVNERFENVIEHYSSSRLQPDLALLERCRIQQYLMLCYTLQNNVLILLLSVLLLLFLLLFLLILHSRWRNICQSKSIDES